MSFLKMTDLDLVNKRVFIREDLNVPIKDGVVTSDARIQAAIPTIEFALKKHAKVMVASHLGRPNEGVFEEEFSLEPVANRLSELLGRKVKLIKNWINGGFHVDAGEVVLLENTRFNIGEKANDSELAKKMAAFCDVYVNDAFATAHRKEASTYGIALHAPVACAGMLLAKELDVLAKATKSPERPVLAIVGGAKVSTKLSLLKSIIEVVDYLIIGGGIANTFIAAKGYCVGTSLYEPELIDEALDILKLAKERKVIIPMPKDVVVAEEFSQDAHAEEVLISQVSENDKILDIGAQTCVEFVELIKKAKTILWNGPVGAFEIEQFSHGTEKLAKAIAASGAFSIAGGGDTIAAIEKYGIEDKISYISTGGGAFLSYLEGETLPAVESLEQSFKKVQKK